jgi:diadenylate cyclase
MLAAITQGVWRPILEILILTIGIYQGIRLLKGTRGMPILTGFSLLLLSLIAMTTFLHLEVLAWFLRTFLAFFVIAILVLFQPELRRILAELGNKPLFNTTKNPRQNLETIIQSAARLAEMRIGALIAIQQKDDFYDLVGSGVDIDCIISPEIIETIFFPNNAIHDGGIIVKGDRIVKAACIFPLSNQQNLQKSLGMRHRAALGLSEETDAFVIVVSEETGSISYAYKGQLVRNQSQDTLREALTSLFIKKPKFHSFSARLRSLRMNFKETISNSLNIQIFIQKLSQIIRENLALKFIAVSLSSLIWFTVSYGPANTLQIPEGPLSNQMIRSFWPVPINILNSPNQTNSFEVFPPIVKVTLNGPPSIIEKLTENEITAFVKLNTNQIFFPSIELVHIVVPQGCTLWTVDPEEVKINKINNQPNIK